MHRDYRGRSGPHSIHDARQHAWARLVFGPGAPAPRQRPHRGMLPDVYYPEAPGRPSLFVRLMRQLRGKGDNDPEEELGDGSGRTDASAETREAGEDRLAA